MTWISRTRSENHRLLGLPTAATARAVRCGEETHDGDSLRELVAGPIVTFVT